MTAAADHSVAARVGHAEPAHLGYLDALRGYAILGVMAVHVVQRSPHLPDLLWAFLYSGEYGVQLFFMVSAVTLLHSWTERNDGAGPFYLRRLFRIGPMWYLAIFSWTMLRLVAPQLSEFSGKVLPVQHLVLTASYLHVWFPETINNVVPGGWSIGDEATFYLIFPLLVLLCPGPWRAALFVAAAIGISFLGDIWHPPLTGSTYEDRAFLYFWFPHQIPAFAFGILTFQLIRAWRPPHWLAELSVVVALAAIVLMPMLFFDEGGPIAYGLIFLPLIYGLAHGGGSYLVNRVVRWIGQRSYSAYFWHLGLLGIIALVPAPDPYLGFALKYGVLFAVTFALSHLTYHWVEQPGIRLGKRLLTRLRVPAAQKTLPAGTSGP